MILALFIPTRPPPDLKALMTQANTIVAAEARQRRRGAAARAVAAGAAGARCDPRPAGIAGGPPAAARRGALELSGAAAVRARQRRGRPVERGVERPSAIAARDHGRARDRQAARADARRRRSRSGCGVAVKPDAVLLAPARRRRRAGRHRLHHVAVHRRPGVPDRSRFRRRQDRACSRPRSCPR